MHNPKILETPLMKFCESSLSFDPKNLQEFILEIHRPYNQLENKY